MLYYTLFCRMNKNPRSCIRVYADQEAIQGGKAILRRHQDQLDQLSNSFSLVGNKVRLSILFLLNQKGKLCVCDLSDVLEMTMAAVSQHLRKLKDGGLVRTERVGQTIFYSIHEDQLFFLNTLLSLFSNGVVKETNHI